jgi:multiple sugar transport system permease protein
MLQSRRLERHLSSLGTFLALGLLTILLGSPLLWMFSTSLKLPQEVLVFPPQWIPSNPVWENFPRAFEQMRFWHFLRNTVIITTGGMLGVLFSSAVVGYGFARMRFPGRTLLFILVISTMMLPPQVTLIPQFILFRSLGWINTFLPIIVPAFLGQSAFSIFLMRQFFLSLPTEYEDAARVDGANSYQIFWYIMLPLARPGLLTVAIFSFMFYWNDFLQPLIYLTSTQRWPLSLGLMLFRDRFAVPQWNLVMAASLMTIAPCLLLFFFTQRYLTKGVVLGGRQG